MCSGNYQSNENFKFQETSEYCFQCIHEHKDANNKIELLSSKMYIPDGNLYSCYYKTYYKCDKNHLFYTDQDKYHYNNQKERHDKIIKLENKIKEQEDEIQKKDNEIRELKTLFDVTHAPSAPVIAHQVEIVEQQQHIVK